MSTFGKLRSLSVEADALRRAVLESRPPALWESRRYLPSLCDFIQTQGWAKLGPDPYEALGLASNERVSSVGNATGPGGDVYQGLIREGLLVQQDGRYRLSAKGRPAYSIIQILDDAQIEALRDEANSLKTRPWAT